MENLEIFEQSDNLQTIRLKTGGQWNTPFGWSPLELIAKVLNLEEIKIL